MRRSIRFAVGVGLGAGGLVVYLLTVGFGDVLTRATAIAPWALGLVVAYKENVPLSAGAN